MLAPFDGESSARRSVALVGHGRSSSGVAAQVTASRRSSPQSTFLLARVQRRPEPHGCAGGGVDRPRFGPCRETMCSGAVPCSAETFADVLPLDAAADRHCLQKHDAHPLPLQRSAVVTPAIPPPTTTTSAAISRGATMLGTGPTGQPSEEDAEVVSVRDEGGRGSAALRARCYPVAPARSSPGVRAGGSSTTDAGSGSAWR